MITGVVLAAGASERMGMPKLVLPFRDTTMLAATVAVVEASRLDRIVVVTGHEAGVVEATLGPGRSVIVRNPGYRRGNMSSLLIGADAMPDSDAYVVVPGDEPTTRTQVVDGMISFWERERPWAAVTAYRDRDGHPMLLSSASLDEMRPFPGEKVLGRRFFEEGDVRVERLTVPHDAPCDVNTPDDYERVRRE